MADRVKLDRKVQAKYHTPGGRWGNRKGIPNKTTRLLKDAIILACEQHGEDGKGRDGLVGYLKMVAKDYPKSMCSLLQKVLPLHVKTDQPIDPVTQAIMTELANDYTSPRGSSHVH